MNKENLLKIAYIFLILFLSRIIKHPPNFTPVISMAIMLPIFFRDFKYSFIIFLISIFVSDVFIGFYDGMLFNYLVYFGIYLSSFLILRKSINKKIILLSISCPVLFFVLSNFYVWLFSGIYNLSFSGLLQCYVMAIPFFQYTLLSTVFFNFLGFTYLFARERKSRSIV